MADSVVKDILSIDDPIVKGSWIKYMFLKLTKNLHPHGQESYIEEIFKDLNINYQKDIVNNYYVIVGESKSMFTSHLDNHTRELKKVTHVFFDNNRKVKTDEKTPLGSDDKAGVVIMLNMILHKIPGTYYFFVGEEPVLTYGCKGSKDIFKSNPDFFNKFERCIAFDRKGYGSIISRQRGRRCCSKEFVAALVSEFAANGMEYKDDPCGVYTDSAVFMEVIPEVTNLSCGGFKEHTPKEMQNLDYLERVANATLNIKWDNLPVVRDPSVSDWFFIPKKKKKNQNVSQYKKETKGKPASKREGLIMATKKPENKIFSFEFFTTTDTLKTYNKVKEYMGFLRYNPDGFKYNQFGDIFSEFYSQKLHKTMKINITGKRLYITDGKQKYDSISLKDFERMYNIGFAAKFYKYSELFIQDLKSYSKNTGFKRVNFYVVNNILKQYGDFQVKDLIREYDLLFDQTDFKILRKSQEIEV